MKKEHSAGKFKRPYQRVAFCVLLGTLAGGFLFFLLGISTAVLTNSYFTRMTPVTFLDRFFLFTTAILFGIYIGLISYKYTQKTNTQQCVNCGIGGIFSGTVAIACPVCNQFLVWIFGSVFIMNFIDPLRPVFGILSIILLVIAIVQLVKQIIPRKGSVVLPFLK